MKIGDLVISKGTTDGKIGVLKFFYNDLAQVYWLHDGDQTWCMLEHVEVIYENR